MAQNCQWPFMDQNPTILGKRFRAANI